MSTVDKPVIITDKNGKKIGVSPTAYDAIRAGQIRLVVRIMIKNKAGQYLIQKRNMNMLNYPGYWDNSAAGHVDEGETPEEAAYRELDEEVGIKDVILTKVAEYYSEYPIPGGLPDSRCYSFLYVGECEVRTEKVVFDSREVAEVKWVSQKEIKKIIQAEQASDGLMSAFTQLTRKKIA